MLARRVTWWVPYAFCGPFLVLTAVFLVYPVSQAFSLATQQTFGPSVSQNVGLRNFTWMGSDPLFWTSLWNTSLFAAASVLIQLPCALGLALLLNRPDMPGRGLLRLAFFSPNLVGLVYAGVIFGLIFEKRHGLLNIALHRLVGWDLEYPWLQEAIMPAMILAALWLYTGFNMVYFLAALQSVRVELLESARMDGATAWQRFLHVTLPEIRPVASFIVLLSLIGSFQLFELPWVLLRGEAGPENRGLTMVTYLYRTGFELNDLGYASALGLTLTVILALFALLQYRLGNVEN